MKKKLVKTFPKMYSCYLKVKALRSFLEYKYYSSLSEEKYSIALAKIYKRKTKDKLDWNDLKTYNEKMQWAKLYDNTPLKTKLSDKYQVREWVKEKIGEEYLIPLLGVWDSFDEIDFDTLPEKFVLKTNHGSGTNIIVNDKKKLDKKKAKKQFDKWMKINYAYKSGFELHYRDIQPKIIAEKYIVDDEGELKDFKFLCFDGKVHYCWIDTGRFTDHRRNVYDLKWELQDWTQHTYKNTDNPVPKPENYDVMISLAEKLCSGFSHVRVDLYNVNGDVYFGEMTFTNGSGFEKISPHKYNLMLGSLWELPIDESKMN